MTFFAVVGFIGSIATVFSFWTGKASLSEINIYNEFISKPTERQSSNRIFDRDRYLAIPVDKKTLNCIVSESSLRGNYFVGFDRSWYFPIVCFCAFNFNNDTLIKWRSFSILKKTFDPFSEDRVSVWSFCGTTNRLAFSQTSDYGYRIDEISILDLASKLHKSYEISGLSNDQHVNCCGFESKENSMTVFLSNPVNVIYVDNAVVWRGNFTRAIVIDVVDELGIYSK